MMTKPPRKGNGLSLAFTPLKLKEPESNKFKVFPINGGFHMQNDIPDTQDVFVQTFIVATHLAGTWLVFNTN